MQHLLVIDGESSIRDLLQSELRPCRITWTTTRHDARQILRRSAIDLVILESRLPDGCGLELLNEIKRDSPGLPVIIVTGYGSEAVCARAFKLGARDYFTKPVVVAGLLPSIRQISLIKARQGHPRENILRPTMSPTAVQPRTGDPRIDLALRLIHEHYAERLSVGAIASAAGTDLYSLSRTFTAMMGVPFRTYLLRVRVARAEELLGDGSVPVADVAERVGFRDPSWFNKVFKRYQGVPPTVFRRRSQARKSRRAARNS